MPVLDAQSLDLRLADLSTFLTVARFGSINGAARGLGTSPSQVSKTVEKLERRLKLNLLTRGARGVQVSPSGRLALLRFEAILAELGALYSVESESRQQFTLVATAFLNSAFVPVITSALPNRRIRSIELPPGLASAYAAERLFDAALTVGTETWPKSWVRTRIGSLRRALFGSPTLAAKLGRTPIDPERLAEISFIAPVYSYHGQVVPGEDQCPLTAGERRIGHQTQTVALALELAQASDQAVFAPEIAARPYVARGALVEVPVVGWDVQNDLYLVCDGDRLMASVLRDIITGLRGALNER